MILRKYDLNAQGKEKDIDSLNLSDFRRSFHDLAMAFKILYIEKGRIKVLKDRWPTEWSIEKKRNKR